MYCYLSVHGVFILHDAIDIMWCILISDADYKIVKIQVVDEKKIVPLEDYLKCINIIVQENTWYIFIFIIFYLLTFYWRLSNDFSNNLKCMAIYLLIYQLKSTFNFINKHNCSYHPYRSIELSLISNLIIHRIINIIFNSD